jgi:hypothetical protein
MNDDQGPILALYAQPCEHFPAYIAGNRDGLIELRNAIDRALSTGDSEAEVFQSDGEGYDVSVVLAEGEDARLLYCFYTTETSWEDRPNARHPHDILGDKYAPAQKTEGQG